MLSPKSTNERIQSINKKIRTPIIKIVYFSYEHQECLEWSSHAPFERILIFTLLVAWFSIDSQILPPQGKLSS